MAADGAEHRFRWRRQPRRLLLKLVGGEKARRHAECLSHRVHRRLVGLDINRDDARHRPFGESVLVQRCPHQRQRLIRGGIALTADADGQDRRMKG